MCVHGRNITYVRIDFCRLIPGTFVRIWYIIRTWCNTKTKISRTHAQIFSPLKPRLVEHTHRFFFLNVAIRNSLRSNNAYNILHLSHLVRWHDMTLHYSSSSCCSHVSHLINEVIATVQFVITGQAPITLERKITSGGNK